ncbi:hypothetical protein ACHAW6_014672 [Cyclotella cf. meneghiniana]
MFYIVDASHIKLYPIKSCHRTELLCVYNNVYVFLCFPEYCPQIHKQDNESSHDVKTFITKNNTSFKYTHPDIHQTNIAECAIRTWKNHFVAMRADLEQTDITLNMMRPCTQNLNLSAHKALEGMFSFNATPMAPIETECMIHNKPTHCHTRGYHAIKDWYFVPALNHYRCIKAVTNTGAVSIANTFAFSTILCPLQLSVM